MKSPTKRIFYHFGVYTLYMGTILVAFWHCGYCWGGLFCCLKDSLSVSQERNFKKSHSDKTFYHLE